MKAATISSTQWAERFDPFGEVDLGAVIRNRLNAEGFEWAECERLAGLILEDVGNPASLTDGSRVWVQNQNPPEQEDPPDLPNPPDENFWTVTGLGVYHVPDIQKYNHRIHMVAIDESNDRWEAGLFPIGKFTPIQQATGTKARCTEAARTWAATFVTPGGHNA